MRYVNNGIIKTIEQVRIELPTISMREGADLSEYGYPTLIETPMPTKAGFHYTEGVDINNTQVWNEVANVVSIPQEVLSYQAKEALILSGIMPSQIETIINGLASPTKELAMNQWLNAPTFKRYNSWISQLAPLIPLTDTELDEFFVLADTL